ncbi:MAG: hypothetical protein AUK55_01165 [Syntrophobacteraceae bacterium CG2_30_61_12]|nr:MAG: hypothetical protein AUK55_01165 [Syntrophobacteraceae bacterium CG2_30_61_12]PIU31131.1 MAG: hypothetical protein COT06_09820 [Syntrophobacteraceae bacterium CG07_land_8_20_14_0_80_61_8]
MIDLEQEYAKSQALAQRHFRKDVDGFRQRRRLELEDLLKTEREKPEELQDPVKLKWVLKELENMDS